jgi:glycosyltransferase involved in cell wall biosynthesis
MSVSQSRFLPRLLLVLPDNLPSATIYIIKPLTELARQNRLKLNLATESETTTARLHASDIVLFCRNIEPNSDWILEECLCRSIPTVYDLDDNLWEVPEGLKYAVYYNSPERIRQMERFLSQVNLVRVYSKPLVERALRFNPNVNMVVPCIDMDLVPRVPLSRRDDKIRITYVTGRGSSDSLISLFSQDLLKLANAYPNAVEMYWWGEVPAEFVHHPSTRLVPIIHDYDQYMHYLSHQGFEIGLAPLTPSSFNLSKTNTKFRDYGACRIPGIYSDVEVYSSCVDHEQTGILVRNTSGSWFDAMQRLLIDTKLREQIKEAAYEYVDRNYRQELVELQWLDTIDALLETQSRNHYAPPPASECSTRVCLVDEFSPPPGFIGIGVQPAPGVQVVADLAASLPFAMDSVDVLLSDRLLDQTEHPDRVIREFYRVCRHGAQLTIQAGYSLPDADREGDGNIYSFNEATPRGWTSFEPPAYQTIPGLGEFDVGERTPQTNVSPVLDIDLRCTSIEFFYSSEVLSIPEQEKRRLRRQDPGVCQRILYRCVVVKRPISPAELQSWARVPFIDPPQLIVQRLQDDNEILKDEIVQNHIELRTQQARLKSKEIELITQNTEFDLQMPLARLMAQEMDAYRNRKIIRVLERLIDRVDYSAHLSAAYLQIRDDSLIFFYPLKNFRLRPSHNLQRVSHLSYPISLPRSGLNRLSFAAVIDLYPRVGTIGVEIIGQDKVLVSASLPVNDIRADAPVSFTFPPLANASGGSIELRVFARDLDVPLRIYEWHYYPFGGLGNPRIKPFCSFDFYSPK